MGKTGPNYWQKDDGQAGTTDHKFREKGEKLWDEDKAAVNEQSDVPPREASEPIPRPHDNPVQARMRAEQGGRTEGHDVPEAPESAREEGDRGS